METLASSMLVRDAVPADLDEIAELIKELETLEQILNQPVISSKDLFKACGFAAPTTDPEIVILVVKIQGALIAYAVLMPGYSARAGRILLLKHLFVRDTHRAQGLGRAILKVIAKYALDNGYAWQENHLVSWNGAAVKFYERMGAEDLSVCEGWAYLRLEI